jgi:hypothetical protein
VPFAVEFFKDGQCIRIAFMLFAELPVAGQDNAVGMYQWGSHSAEYVSDEQPGRLFKWPEGGHVPLRVVKNGDWWQLKPRPVRIAAAAFLVYHRKLGEEVSDWVKLKPGEYIQGALVHKYAAQRLYVVTVDPPPEWSAVTCPWPRIVRAGRPSQ